ncbi:class I SAM-dependent methyltransferase [Rubripirellula reticaptiva]|uniref:C-methyltransferase CouO n=1 Tax=Rubripirellula reticaptiva TaxID=2528013 RepID=A0A5C6F6R0_9BACT|nr:class I SAM-dependent methyltransferase [Rubripirellula reticaptiva]TWU56097.1 C-methyltransferase CouO [Rubripirellula reticaptiva]
MTLSRVPEPKPENAREDADEYFAMDHLAINQQFVDDFLSGKFNNQNFPATAGPRVIDLGCGPGQIPILLCQADPNIEMLAVDLEVEMLEIAKIEIDIAGMLGRIRLEQADITDMSVFEDGLADAVISNSAMHHLDEPSLGLATAVRLARPGGRVFIRDLSRPDSEAEIESLVSLHGDGHTDAAKQMLRQSLWAALSIDEVHEIAARMGIEGLGARASCVQMTSDRHWTLDWVKPMIQ